MIGVKELDNDGIKLELLSGSCEISKPGNYVIASGCGSGKTSAIVELIMLKLSEGVLYSARTIEECNLMYEYLIDRGVDSEKILLLHSSSSDNSIYLNNSDLISDYDVVICTHYKLMNTPSELLLIQKVNNDIPPHMRYWAEEEVGPNRLRKYILIDEMIETPGFTSRVPKHLIASLLLRAKRGEITRTKYGYSYVEILKWYKEYSEVMGESSLNFLDNYKQEYILSLLSESLDDYTDLESIEEETIEISYTLLDMLPGRTNINVSDARRPYFMIFDGTGDIFYKGSENLKILTTEDRYVAPIHINSLEFGINRYYKYDYEVILEKLNKLSDNLAEVIKRHDRVLVVTWKNLKGDITTGIDDVVFDTENFDYIESLENNLSIRGVLKSKYSIIYYQSGEDRAVNDFVNYDSIVFLGNHKVHSIALTTFNKYNKTSMSMLDFQAQMIVQAISRCRIRLHNPELDTTVYFTEDWDADLVKYVDLYMNNNYSVRRIYRYFKDKRWFLDITPRWREVVLKLNEEFNDIIKDYYLLPERERTDLDIAIYKHNLMKLYPTDGTLKRYHPFMEYLKFQGIRLTVLYPSTRYLKISKDGELINYTIHQHEMEKYIKDGYRIETKFKSFNV